MWLRSECFTYLRFCECIMDYAGGAAELRTIMALQNAVFQLCYPWDHSFSVACHFQCSIKISVCSFCQWIQFQTICTCIQVYFIQNIL